MKLPKLSRRLKNLIIGRNAVPLDSNFGKIDTCNNHKLGGALMNADKNDTKGNS